MLKHFVFCDYFKGINKRLGVCLLASSFITHKNILCYSVFVFCVHAGAVFEHNVFAWKIFILRLDIYATIHTDYSFQYCPEEGEVWECIRQVGLFTDEVCETVMCAVFRTSKFDFLDRSVTTTLLFVLHLCFLNSATTDMLKRPIIQE